MIDGIPIPIPCPKCSGKMIAVKYISPLKVLGDRGWHVCKECHLTRSIEDFKKALATV